MLGLNWGGGISCGFACKVSVLFGLKLARVSDRFKGPRRKCKFFYMVTGRQWLDASPKGLQLGKPAECLNAHVMLVVCDQGFGQQILERTLLACRPLVRHFCIVCHGTMMS